MATDTNQQVNVNRGSEQKLPPPYETAMLKILLKIRMAFNLTSMDPDDLREQAAVWSSVLQDFKVKLESLDACYRRAMRDHRERFPITVTDMLTAQEKLWGEEPSKQTCQFCDWRKHNTALPACPQHGLKVGNETLTVKA